MPDPVAVSPAREIKVHFFRLLRYLLFWILLFQSGRVAFLLYHAHLARDLDPAALAGIFGYGLPMDAATACYLLVIPYLIWFLQLFRPDLRTWAIDAYSVCLTVLVALICTSDLEIYREWGVKLNSQALGYLRYPKEAAASMGSSPIVLLGAIWLSLAALGVLLYRKLRIKEPVASAGNSPSAVAVRGAAFLAGAALMVVCIRGGIGQAPMNPAFAYFSRHQFANHAALNVCWNLLYDLKHAAREKGVRYSFMSDDEMRRRLAAFVGSDEGKGEPVLKVERPNIVCIILESWTADVVQSLGGVPEITPNLERLIGEGMLFTGIYASGNRTSYGIPSVLSGYPSMPSGSIMEHPPKMEKLPALPLELRKAGYRSAFYYGGDARFDNMNAFFLHGGFEKVVDQPSFDPQGSSKWGAHDHALYEKVLTDLSGMRQPFFVSMLTLSSHEPYTVPMPTVIEGSDETSLFKNAMVYADRSLGEFFRKASRESWYGNTLFVLVADHGHRLPAGRLDHSPEKYRIPLLLCGPALKDEYRGTRRATLGSQSDIAATLLGQLGLSRRDYPWSNDLLKIGRREFAFYSFKNGFGWRTPGRTLSFDTVSGKVLSDAPLRSAAPRSDETLRDGQAYLQYLAERYASY